MANKKFWLGMLVMVLAFGLTVVGCDDGSTNGNSKDITLVCLGDSLTAGYGATTPGVDDRSKSYPAYLQKKANTTVINAGVDGDTTAQGLARVDSDVLSHNPDIVIILLGGNDVWDNVPVSTIQANLQSIINKAANGNRKIFLAKFYTNAIATELAIPPATINQFNNMFTTLAPSSSNITIIEDIWAGVWGVHMSDSVHPNAKGYEIMADNIYKVLRPYLQTLR